MEMALKKTQEQTLRRTHKGATDQPILQPTTSRKPDQPVRSVQPIRSVQPTATSLQPLLQQPTPNRSCQPTTTTPIQPATTPIQPIQATQFQPIQTTPNQTPNQTFQPTATTTTDIQPFDQIQPTIQQRRRRQTATTYFNVYNDLNLDVTNHTTGLFGFGTTTTTIGPTIPPAPPEADTTITNTATQLQPILGKRAMGGKTNYFLVKTSDSTTQ